MRPVHRIQPPLHPPPVKPFERAIAGVGLVEPASELVAVSARVPGAIAEVHVQVGAEVARGEPLFTLDDRDVRAEIELRRAARATAEARLHRLESLPRPEELPVAEARVEVARSLLADARASLGFLERVTDRRAIREEDLSRRRHAAATAEAGLREAEAALALLRAGAWEEDVLVARAEVEAAEAALARAEADLDRLTVRAPIDGLVLELDAHAGEYAPAGRSEEPLLLLGSSAPLHLRVDVNEEDAARVYPEARALARARGDEGSFELEFVRFEPHVVPKRSLSGSARERVDTRVLQVVYRIADPTARLFVGQQLDVFVERTDVPPVPE
jgi:multidrug resistance efflux pump